MALRHAEKRLYLGHPVKNIFSNLQAPLYRYQSAVYADAPQVYWPGQDASGHLKDISGGGFDSTTETNLTYADTSNPLSDNSLCIVKNANGQAFRAATGTAVNNVSMEIWVKFISGVGGNQAFARADQTNKGWGIIMTSATKFAVVVQGVAIEANCAATIDTTTWRHIVAVRDAGTWKYYVNGALDTANAGSALPVANTGGNVGIEFAATTSMAFRWAHFAYYETALSATQVSKHYNAGVG